MKYPFERPILKIGDKNFTEYCEIKYDITSEEFIVYIPFSEDNFEDLKKLNEITELSNDQISVSIINDSGNKVGEIKEATISDYIVKEKGENASVLYVKLKGRLEYLMG